MNITSESFSFIGKRSANCATREQGMTIDVEEGKGVASLKIDAGSVTHFHSSLSIFNDFTHYSSTTLLFSLYFSFHPNYRKSKYIVSPRNNLAE